MAITPTIAPILLGSIRSLSVALDARDAYTQAHCNRVVTLALELGMACEVPYLDLSRLCVSAQFHDVGKIGVPDAVLLKPGRLDEQEWSLMKAHSEHGENIFRATELPDLEAIAPLIRHHHEAYDGSGYPDGFSGESIPLLSRIILIVDAYDAMGSARPYHRARGHKEVMSVLDSEVGKKLDPYVFAQFAKLIDRSDARVA